MPISRNQVDAAKHIQNTLEKRGRKVDWKGGDRNIILYVGEGSTRYVVQPRNTRLEQSVIVEGGQYGKDSKVWNLSKSYSTSLLAGFHQKEGFTR